MPGWAARLLSTERDLRMVWDVTRHGRSVALGALKPWMAFFGVWTRFRTRLGDSYSLDLDAARTAERLGKTVHHLETIAEQIAPRGAPPPPTHAPVYHR